jgi:hypothetical protein
MRKLLCKIFIGKFVELDDFAFIDRYLRKRGYDEYGSVYTKGFVVIELHKKSGVLVSIDIFHDQVSKGKQVIEKNFVTGLIIAENYFKRI